MSQEPVEFTIFANTPRVDQLAAHQIQWLAGEVFDAISGVLAGGPPVLFTRREPEPVHLDEEHILSQKQMVRTNHLLYRDAEMAIKVAEANKKALIDHWERMQRVSESHATVEDYEANLLNMMARSKRTGDWFGPRPSPPPSYSSMTREEARSFLKTDFSAQAVELARAVEKAHQETIARDRLRRFVGNDKYDAMHRRAQKAEGANAHLYHATLQYRDIANDFFYLVGCQIGAGTRFAFDPVPLIRKAADDPRWTQSLKEGYRAGEHLAKPKL